MRGRIHPSKENSFTTEQWRSKHQDDKGLKSNNLYNAFISILTTLNYEKVSKKMCF